MTPTQWYCRVVVNASLVPRPSRSHANIYARLFLIIPKVWSIWWCNDDVTWTWFGRMWASSSFLDVLRLQAMPNDAQNLEREATCPLYGSKVGILNRFLCGLPSEGARLRWDDSDSHEKEPTSPYSSFYLLSIPLIVLETARKRSIVHIPDIPPNHVQVTSPNRPDLTAFQCDKK